MSPSSRGRGLKSSIIPGRLRASSVALFARAWIEILNAGLYLSAYTRSPSSRGRGLKLCERHSFQKQTRSPSSRGRGLKCPQSASAVTCRMSPSSRGRGLKYELIRIKLLFQSSPSSRGRGLKSLSTFADSWILPVALFARAWIEMIKADKNEALTMRRPLREGVD